MLRSKILISDILEMIERIEYSSRKSGVNFKNLAYYDSTLMRLQIIGESVKKLPKEELKKYPEVDWNSFVKFREVVSHNYFKINYKILDDLIKTGLPKLKVAIKKIGHSLL